MVECRKASGMNPMPVGNAPCGCVSASPSHQKSQVLLHRFPRRLASVCGDLKRASRGCHTGPQGGHSTGPIAKETSHLGANPNPRYSIQMHRPLSSHPQTPAMQGIRVCSSTPTVSSLGRQKAH